MNKDSLSVRMKEFYEDRTRIKLPRRTYTVIRIDGKAFHTYTKGLERPFDAGFVEDMNKTACYLCENIQGAKMAYVQSDEISVILTDFDNLQTEAWFDGNIQKMASVSASLATAKFNELRLIRFIEDKESKSSKKIAMFDSRVFTIPSYQEVINYLIWRQRDAVKNSIQSMGQSNFSHKELHGKNTNQIQEMLFQEKGINWNDLEDGLKRGRMIVKVNREDLPQRTYWDSMGAINFTSSGEVTLFNIIPQLK